MNIDEIKKLIAEAEAKKLAENNKKEMGELIAKAKELGIDIPDEQIKVDSVPPEAEAKKEVEAKNTDTKKSEDSADLTKLAESISKLSENVSKTIKEENKEDKPETMVYY